MNLEAKINMIPEKVISMENLYTVEFLQCKGLSHTFRSLYDDGLIINSLAAIQSDILAVADQMIKAAES